MKNSDLTLEHALYILALVIAVGVRFLNLGVLPLSDYEAGWALQALHVAQGLKPALDSNPAYIHLTAILFFIFSATEFLARFWSALAGSLLAVMPFFFRDRLGRIPALVLAFGLAIDPGLTALSRLAGGSMLAIAFIVLAWGTWKQGRRVLAGIFAGLTLLSGPSVWFGLLGLLISWGIGTGLQPKKPEEQAKGKPGRKKPAPAPAFLSWETLRMPILWGTGTLLVVGTLLLLSPKGIPAFIASFLAFLRGWVTLSGVPALHILISLPIYELLPLAFGLAGAVRGIVKGDVLSKRLGLWALVTLVLTLIYPGKQVADLAWVVLPLWGLAALEIGRHFDFEGHNNWVLALVVTVIVALSTFAWLNLTIVTTMDLTTGDARNRLFFSGLAVLLAFMSWLLVSVTWSQSTARLGGIWAVVVVLTAYTLGVMTAAGGLRQPLTSDLWKPEPRTAGADLLLKTVNQISDWNKGAVDSLPVTVVGVDSPALLWTLRKWDVQVADSLSPADSPALVVTPANVELTLAEGYSGEGFAWRETTSWNAATSTQWLNWVVYHQMPEQHDEIVLWARGDLILENQGEPATP